jgi:hypothetical protein
MLGLLWGRGYKKKQKFTKRHSDGRAKVVQQRPSSMSSASIDHWDACKERGSSGCAKCKYLRLSPKWKKRLVIHESKKQLGSWLCHKWRKGKFGMGCAACACEQTGTKASTCSWSGNSVVQLGFLQRHARTFKHRNAVAKLIDLPVPVDVTQQLAPSPELFKKVLERIRSSGSGRSVEGVGTGRKVSKLRYCLAEACREYDRRFLRKSESIVIHGDAKGKRFGIRFSASQRNLSVRKGALGQIWHLEQGHGAAAIPKSIESIIKVFCTPLFGAPQRRLEVKQTPKCDTALFKRVLGAVEMYNPDRASDEQSAGRVMRDSASSKFPNLKVVTYDHTHAARRSLNMFRPERS